MDGYIQIKETAKKWEIGERRINVEKRYLSVSVAMVTTEFPKTGRLYRLYRKK